MRGLLLFLLFFLLPAPSAAQQSAPPQAEQPRPAEKCAIQGQVLKVTDEPMQGVDVQALRYSFYQGRRQLFPFGSVHTLELKAIAAKLAGQ